MEALHPRLLRSSHCLNVLPQIRHNRQLGVCKKTSLDVWVVFLSTLSHLYSQLYGGQQAWPRGVTVHFSDRQRRAVLLKGLPVHSWPWGWGEGLTLWVCGFVKKHKQLKLVFCFRSASTASCLSPQRVRTRSTNPAPTKVTGEHWLYFFFF